MHKVAAREYQLGNIEDFVGQEIGVSDWLQISQADINAFGAATRDPDPNHIDPEHAAKHSPFGQPVAFGFQTLSMLTYLGKQAGMVPAGVVEEVNYGLDRVRFISPVPVGSRIRGRVTLTGAERRGAAGYRLTFHVEVEIEGGKEPALVADWLAYCSNVHSDTGG